MRVTGAALLASGVALGAVAALWTLWRAAGAEADFCRGATCVTAYFVTVPALGLGVALGWSGLRLLRHG